MNTLARDWLAIENGALVSDQDNIKKTYINTTQEQRNYYIHLMQQEKKRTNDGSLNLSEWIIRQLPEVPDDWKK